MRGRLLVLAVVLAGCSSGIPQSGTSPTLVSTAAPSATPTANPSSLASPTPAATASPQPFVIKWTRSSVNPGVRDFLEARRLRPFQGRFVLLGSSGKVWTTEDGLRWQQAAGISSGTEVDVEDLTVGGPGMVAVGQEYSDDGQRAAVWTSTDGRTWTRLADQSSFAGGDMTYVGATRRGLVAFGSTGAWTSSDGLRWQRAPGISALMSPEDITRLIVVDDSLVAFVSNTPADAIEVWRSADGATWRKVAQLPRSANSEVQQAAGGPSGWAAIGFVRNSGLRVGWTSRDGKHWQRARDTSAFKGGTVRYLIALDAGFVAVGFSGEEPGTTCGTGEPIIGHTWTSTDGSTWREMPHEKQFELAVLYALYARNDTLFMLGGFFPTRSGERTTVWTAKLPSNAASAKPARSVRASPGAGCGP